MSTPTRQRIVEAGADLLRHKGYAATGVKEIVAAAQAPFGSLYHHFPGGKEQLGEEVIRFGGAEYGKLGPLVFDAAPDVVTGVRMFFDGAADNLAETEWTAGCPIATVALEVAATNEPLRQATADVFTAWIDAGTEKFAQFGISAEAARTLTITAVNNLEGAFVLCRALRDTEAMAVAGAATVDVAKRLLDENAQL
jgi:AcrR family transcriptional regulator